MYQHVKTKAGAENNNAESQTAEAENNNADFHPAAAAEAAEPENFEFGEVLNFDITNDDQTAKANNTHHLLAKTENNTPELGPEDFNFNLDDEDTACDADDDRSCDTQEQRLWGYHWPPTSEDQSTTDEEPRPVPGTPPPAKIARPGIGLTDSSLTPDQYYVASPEYIFTRPQSLFPENIAERFTENFAAPENAVVARLCT